MPSRKKRLAGLFITFLTAVHLFILQLPVTTSYCGEIKETTPIEAEDRDFIHHLLKDRYFVYAKEEAIDYLDRYPEGIFRAEVIFVLAEIAVVEKSYKNAVTHYDIILNRYPNSELFEDSLYLSGMLHLQLEQSNKGRKKLRQLIQKYPQTRFLYRAYFQLGELAFKEKSWETAAAYLEITIKNGDLTQEKQLEARNYLAWTYYFQQKTDSANTLFLPLLKSKLADIHKAKIAYQYAIDAQKIRKFKEAITWHERLINEWPHPDFVDKSRFWIAESLFLLNQDPQKRISDKEKKKAVGLFSRNLKLDRPIERENSHYHRGWLLLELGKEKQAEQDFSWLQKNNNKYGKNVELTIIRARYFESKKEWRKANLIYTRSLKLQEVDDRKNQLLSGIIRNNYRQKECAPLTRNYEKMVQPLDSTVDNEIYFYTGSCYYDLGNLKKADQVFVKIDLSSRFAALSFEYYLDVLRQTGQQAGGIKYLTRVQELKHFGDKERILLYKTEFHLDLKQWYKALSTMKQLVGISPKKKKDPWFLLNTARTLDQIAIAMKSKQWREQRPDLKSVKYYRRQAIIYYREAYKYMPLEKEEIRLSILDILIKHHEKQKAWKTLIYQYRTAIKISQNDHQRAQYTYRLATIMVKTGEKSEKVIPLLDDLHGTADREVNFKASSLLAELYIGKQNYEAAIEILIDLAQQPIDNTPWYMKVHFRLGELFQSKEKWLASIRHYSKVVNAKQKGGRKKEARARLSKIKKFVTQSQAAKTSKTGK